MKVWIIKHERDIGPVLSSKLKVREWYLDHCDNDEGDETALAEFLSGDSDYPTFVEVEVDDLTWNIDT